MNMSITNMDNSHRLKEKMSTSMLEASRLRAGLHTPSGSSSEASSSEAENNHNCSLPVAARTWSKFPS